MVLLLIWWSFGVPLTEFRPFINDEVTYSHQASTFARAGFGGGFYTSAEVTNPSGLTPFGAHGPGFPVIYGALGGALSWQRYTPVLLNFAFIGLAAWWCLSLTRLGVLRALAFAVLLLTFWPLLLWTPTAMQEGFHGAGAIAVAGCLAAVLAPAPSPTAAMLGWPLLIVLAFVRPSWLALMPVWAIASTWRAGIGRLAAATIAAIVVSIAVLIAYSRTTAPFVPPFFFLRAMNTTVGLQAIWANVHDNLARTLNLGDYKPLEVLMRLQYWGAIGVLAVVAGAPIVTGRGKGTAARPHVVAALATLIVALAGMLVLYTLTNAAEQRVLSAFLLLAAILTLSAPGRIGLVLPAALVASNLAAAGVFLHAFKEERQDNFVWDHRPLRDLERAIEEGGVRFAPGASRWCNTLLTSQFPPFLTAVPAGIGLSVVREPEGMHRPPRSRYLLLSDDALAAFGASLHTTPLARLPYGTLSVNLDADCR